VQPSADPELVENMVWGDLGDLFNFGSLRFSKYSKEPKKMVFHSHARLPKLLTSKAKFVILDEGQSVSPEVF
jgi:hypothetical protein